MEICAYGPDASSGDRGPKFGYYPGKTVQWLICDKTIIGTGDTVIKALHSLANNLYEMFNSQFNGKIDEVFDAIRNFPKHPMDLIEICKNANRGIFNAEIMVCPRYNMDYSTSPYGDTVSLVGDVVRGEKSITGVKISTDRYENGGELLELRIVDGAGDKYVFEYSGKDCEYGFITSAETIDDLKCNIAQDLIAMMLVTLDESYKK